MGCRGTLLLISWIEYAELAGRTWCLGQPFGIVRRRRANSRLGLRWQIETAFPAASGQSKREHGETEHRQLSKAERVNHTKFPKTRGAPYEICPTMARGLTGGLTAV